MSQELSETDVFVLLSERRRRLAIQILQEATTPLTATKLAEYIGAREYENPTEEEINTISLALYHSHLPRLEEADVLVHNEEKETVYPGINFDVVRRVLEQVHESDLPWSDA